MDAGTEWASRLLVGFCSTNSQMLQSRAERKRCRNPWNLKNFRHCLSVDYVVAADPTHQARIDNCRSTDQERPTLNAC